MTDPPDTRDQGGEPSETSPSSAAGAAIPAGARCARHPEIAAQGLCERCGNFMCEACASASDGRLCPACSERLGKGAFPYTRADFSLDRLLDYSLECFKQQWQVLCLASLILFGVSFGIGMVAGLIGPLFGLLGGEQAPFLALGVQLLAQIAQTVVQLWLTLGLLSLLLRVLQGERADLALMFARGDKLLPFLGQTAIISLLLGGYLAIAAAAIAAGASAGDRTSLVITIGAVLLAAVPVVWLMLNWSFAALHLVHDPQAGAIASLKASYRIARGHRWSIVGVGLVALLIYVAGFLMCCVGAVASAPLAGLLWCSLYLALSEESGRTT